jgi:hypothetical protein
VQRLTERQNLISLAVQARRLRTRKAKVDTQRDREFDQVIFGPHSPSKPREIIRETSERPSLQIQGVLTEDRDVRLHAGEAVVDVGPSATARFQEMEVSPGPTGRADLVRRTMEARANDRTRAAAAEPESGGRRIQSRPAEVPPPSQPAIAGLGTPIMGPGSAQRAPQPGGEAQPEASRRRNVTLTGKLRMVSQSGMYLGDAELDGVEGLI